MFLLNFCLFTLQWTLITSTTSAICSISGITPYGAEIEFVENPTTHGTDIRGEISWGSEFFLQVHQWGDLSNIAQKSFGDAYTEPDDPQFFRLDQTVIGSGTGMMNFSFFLEPGIPLSTAASIIGRTIAMHGDGNVLGACVVGINENENDSSDAYGAVRPGEVGMCTFIKFGVVLNVVTITHDGENFSIRYEERADDEITGPWKNKTEPTTENSFSIQMVTFEDSNITLSDLIGKSLTLKRNDVEYSNCVIGRSRPAAGTTTQPLTTRELTTSPLTTVAGLTTGALVTTGITTGATNATNATNGAATTGKADPSATKSETESETTEVTATSTNATEGTSATTSSGGESSHEDTSSEASPILTAYSMVMLAILFISTIGAAFAYIKFRKQIDGAAIRLYRRFVGGGTTSEPSPRTSQRQPLKPPVASSSQVESFEWDPEDDQWA